VAGPLGGMVGASSPEQKAEIMREQVQSSPFLRSVIVATGLKSDPSVRHWAIGESSKYKQLNQDERVEAFLIDYLRDAIQIRRGKGDVFQITVGDLTAERARRLADAVARSSAPSSRRSTSASSTRASSASRRSAVRP
jgi:hypothetical protein